MQTAVRWCSERTNIYFSRLLGSDSQRKTQNKHFRSLAGVTHLLGSQNGAACVQPQHYDFAWCNFSMFFPSPFFCPGFSRCRTSRVVGGQVAINLQVLVCQVIDRINNVKTANQRRKRQEKRVPPVLASALSATEGAGQDSCSQLVVADTRDALLRQTDHGNPKVRASTSLWLHSSAEEGFLCEEDKSSRGNGGSWFSDRVVWRRVYEGFGFSPARVLGRSNHHIRQPRSVESRRETQLMWNRR